MRKKNYYYFVFFFSILPFWGFSQVNLEKEEWHSDSLSYLENFDFFIKNIEKQKFKTGVLYDRVYPFAKLHNFKPVNHKDTSSYKHFIQAYYELYLSSFNNSEMKTFYDIKNDVKEKNQKGVVPIGILDFEFNYIDSNAIKTNDLEVVNKQLRVRNKKTSFVKKSEACVFSLLSDKLEQGMINISFDNNFVFTNRKFHISSIELIFGDENRVYTFKQGETKTVKIKKGKTVITYSLMLDNGKKYTGYSIAYVGEKAPLKSTTSNVVPCATINIQSSLSYRDYLGVSKKGTAEMLLYYSSCGDQRIRKPIIICDGFDPGDTRDGIDIYKMINKDYSLADNLRANGFDIIIVNFPTGADFIVRNAYALIDVIKWVNNHKVTNRENIVIGPSMGGLVTRYALAKMEKDGIDHETALWVSFDAPHQGANIPIGDQYFLDFFGRVVNNAGALEGLAKINSPAAKQMLVDHYTKPWNNERPRSSWYRKSFINELTNNGLSGSNGYPQNLRKVALINGSGVGTKQEGIDNTAYLLEMRKKFFGITVALGQIKTSADFSFSRRWVLYAYTASPSVWTQRWSRPSTSSYFTTSYDKAPGGSNPTQATLAEGSSDFTVFYPGHSFIPSVSSLDITNPYLTLNIANANIIQNNRTPFDAYFAPSENQQHITFNSNSINWLNDEIYSAVPCNTTTLINTNYSNNTSIYDCRINVTNCTVKNGAKLTLDADITTTINGPFEVKLGSTLEVK